MNEHERRLEAITELDSRLEAMQADIADAVLGISEQVVTTVDLACGGPSAWIDYEHNTGRATFYTTAPGYAESSGCTEWQLTEEQSGLVASLIGIEA